VLSDFAQDLDCGVWQSLHEVLAERHDVGHELGAAIISPTGIRPTDFIRDIIYSHGSNLRATSKDIADSPILRRDLDLSRAAFTINPDGWTVRCIVLWMLLRELLKCDQHLVPNTFEPQSVLSLDGPRVAHVLDFGAYGCTAGISLRCSNYGSSIEACLRAMCDALQLESEVDYMRCQWYGFIFPCIVPSLLVEIPGLEV
jgi:hypothetical protein